jgi:hypothetical protein
MLFLAEHTLALEQFGLEIVFALKHRQRAVGVVLSLN